MKQKLMYLNKQLKHNGTWLDFYNKIEDQYSSIFKAVTGWGQDGLSPTGDPKLNRLTIHWFE